MQILENIKTHLYILKQKDLHEYELNVIQDNMRPYVAAEGDILNHYKNNTHNFASEEPPQNEEIEGLNTQLNRLDELLNENNKLLSEQLKSEFDHYEEQKHLLNNINTKTRVASSDSMTRLRSAKKYV